VLKIHTNTQTPVVIMVAKATMNNIRLFGHLSTICGIKVNLSFQGFVSGLAGTVSDLLSRPHKTYLPLQRRQDPGGRTQLLARQGRPSEALRQQWAAESLGWIRQRLCLSFCVWIFGSVPVGRPWASTAGTAE
jgi:hypothetical protein